MIYRRNLGITFLAPTASPGRTTLRSSRSKQLLGCYDAVFNASSPIVLLQYGTPIRNMDDLLPHLVKKGGFAGYHYMIVANALIKNSAFSGEEHNLHALNDLEIVAGRLSDTLLVEA